MHIKKNYYINSLIINFINVGKINTSLIEDIILIIIVNNNIIR